MKHRVEKIDDHMKELISGMNHSLNQPMQAIIGYAEIIKIKCDGNDELSTLVDKLLKSTDRVTNILQNLQTMKENGKFKIKPYSSSGIEIVDCD